MSVEFAVIDCPYCGEAFETSVDISAGTQSYTEDCHVCCRPIVMTVTVGADDELESVVARREAD